MSLSDMRDACVRRDIHRAWMEDPGETSCESSKWVSTLVEAIRASRATCSADGPPRRRRKVRPAARPAALPVQRGAQCRALYQWVLRWIALPIQHRAPKMKTTLVLHGGRAPEKEPVLRSDHAHLRKVWRRDRSIGDRRQVQRLGRVASCFSSPTKWLRDPTCFTSEPAQGIHHRRSHPHQPENFAAYWEANHVNLVFLSNEIMPVVLEEDDRRHCVIHTPPKLEKEYYDAVLRGDCRRRRGGSATTCSAWTLATSARARCRPHRRQS